MARNPKKYAAYRKVCRVIGQPVDEFTDRIRAIIGEQAMTSAQVEAFNPKTNRSYTVTVAAAGCDRGDDGEFLLALSETRAAAPADGDPNAASAAAAGGGGKGGAKPSDKGRAPVRKILFKGRVQLPAPRSAPDTAAASAKGGRGGRDGGTSGNGGGGRRRRDAPGLSSIAGVCMLCAVAAAGGIAFYSSYMSQTADHGTITIIRAEIFDLGETRHGRFLDLELFASHTSCVIVTVEGKKSPFPVYEEGDSGCNDRTGLDPPPEAEAYETSTGVHVTMNDYRNLEGDDRELIIIKVETDTASIIQPVRVLGVR